MRSTLAVDMRAAGAVPAGSVAMGAIAASFHLYPFGHLLFFRNVSQSPALSEIEQSSSSFLTIPLVPR
jgi:hypothetical protein